MSEGAAGVGASPFAIAPGQLPPAGVLQANSGAPSATLSTSYGSALSASDATASSPASPARFVGHPGLNPFEGGASPGGAPRVFIAQGDGRRQLNQRLHAPTRFDASPFRMPWLPPPQQQALGCCWIPGFQSVYGWPGSF